MKFQTILKNGVRALAAVVLYASFSPALLANQRDEVILYLNDPLGSAVAAFDEAGQNCWEETHTPYGDKLVMDDSFNRLGCGVVAEERGITGHSEDFETDLVYMQQRYYDPTMGRFLSIDPVGPKAGVPASINRYSYAANNPYKYIDPNGEEPVTATLLTLAAVTGFLITAYDTYSTYEEKGPSAAALTAGRDIAIGALTGGAGKLALSAYRARVLSNAARSGSNVPKSVPASTPVGRTGSWTDTSQFTGNTVKSNRELNVAGAQAGRPPVNTPTTIGGRDYSGHALDRMQQRGYVPSVVEDAIQNGNRNSSYGGASSFYSPSNNVTAIVDDASGRVVTIRGGR